VGDLVFDAGTLLTLGEPKIRMAGIVVKALKTRSKVLVLEGNSHPGNVDTLQGIYSWTLADPDRYGVSKEELDSFLAWGKRRV
jgi:hypothetical protein